MQRHAFICAGCKRYTSDDAPRYEGSSGAYCAACLQEPAVARNAAFPTIIVKGDFDTLGNLVRDGKMTTEKADFYRDHYRKRGAVVRRMKRERGLSKKGEGYMEMGGAIPRELFDDPDGPFGNEPGDTDIASKMKRHGLAF